MKITQLTENSPSYLKVTDLENLFDINIDGNLNYVYNLNQTVYIDFPSEYLQEYTCDCNMHWPLISYKIYGTTRLAWLLMKVNKVPAKSMFDMKKASDKIKFIDKDNMQTIIKSINQYNEY